MVWACGLSAGLDLCGLAGWMKAVPLRQSMRRTLHISRINIGSRPATASPSWGWANQDDALVHTYGTNSIILINAL